MGNVVGVVESLPVLAPDKGATVRLPEAVIFEEEEEFDDGAGASVMVTRMVAVAVLSSRFGPRVTAIENDVETWTLGEALPDVYLERRKNETKGQETVNETQQNEPLTVLKSILAMREERVMVRLNA